jgi:hypothetical protein
VSSGSPVETFRQFRVRISRALSHKDATTCAACRVRGRVLVDQEHQPLSTEPRRAPFRYIRLSNASTLERGIRHALPTFLAPGISPRLHMSRMVSECTRKMAAASSTVYYCGRSCCMASPISSKNNTVFSILSMQFEVKNCLACFFHSIPSRPFLAHPGASGGILCGLVQKMLVRLRFWRVGT